MRYKTFIMGDHKLSSVNSIVITRAARNRKVNTNLNGNLLIDQSEQKRTVTINIVLCSAADMLKIQEAVAAGIVTLTLDEGTELVTMQATCASVTAPNPFYVNGKRESGAYYNNVELVWEER